MKILDQTKPWASDLSFVSNKKSKMLCLNSKMDLDQAQTETDSRLPTLTLSLITQRLLSSLKFVELQSRTLSGTNLLSWSTNLLRLFKEICTSLPLQFRPLLHWKLKMVMKLWRKEDLLNFLVVPVTLFRQQNQQTLFGKIASIQLLTVQLEPL